ncbi:MAG TPA: pyridoxamine 5'-phosphate oxidase [Methanosarcinales archaeon]|nr:pyridoxamine 5'-phosphate oxidase [Methanosarcinales archaeon]
MVKMPADVKEAIEKQSPMPIATAALSGKPNVIFIGLKKIIDDETILIADNFFNKTRKNLEENPQMSMVVYNKDAKKSFQIKGSVDIKTEGKQYDEMVEWVHSTMVTLPAKAAVIFHVEEIYDSMYGPNA